VPKPFLLLLRLPKSALKFGEHALTREGLNNELRLDSRC
jgi:hypothetical protein